jgi:hypothetical protein
MVVSDNLRVVLLTTSKSKMGGANIESTSSCARNTEEGEVGPTASRRLQKGVRKASAERKGVRKASAGRYDEGLDAFVDPPIIIPLKIPVH